jgi:uncharacterized delta-60 repeat protein
MTTNTAPSFILTLPLTTGLGDYYNTAEKIAVQADGKIVLEGFVNSSDPAQTGLDVVRYNSDGTIDSHFGTQGFTKVASRDLGPLPFIVQADGKFLVVGDSSVTRLNSDGSLDTSFGNHGTADIAALGHIDYQGDRGMALQGDGKILIAGGVGGTYSLLRLNSNGSADTTFSGDGKVTLPVVADVTHPASVLVQNDGKIIVACNDGLVRYNSNGSIDSSFTITHDLLKEAALQTDGKVVAVGDYGYPNSGTLYRYNSDGSVDTAFGTGGEVSISNALKVIPEADGKLLVLESGALVRYNSDGSVDTSFGNHGKTSFAFTGADATLQADGTILVTGTGPHYSSNTGTDFYIARYNSNGTADTAFTQTINTADTQISIREVDPISGASYTTVIAAHAHISDAELDALNGGLGNYSGASLTLARHGGANADDAFYAYAYGPLVLKNGTVSLHDNTGTSLVSVGTYQQSGGQLTITFGAATSAQVNQVLDNLTYSYTNPSPTAATSPASLHVDWTFSDGNATQPLSATATTTVNITPRR